MNANDPAHPVSSDHMRDGLTKREYFAGLAMQGYLASFSGITALMQPPAIAESSVAFADALLAELEKQP